MSVEKATETPKKQQQRSYEGIPTKVTKVTEELSCELNEVEWQNRARELADAHGVTNSQKDRKKSVMAELNADLKSAEAKESKLANIVSNRRELRDVTVEVRHDYEKGLIIKTRLDTKQETDRREMTTTERQSSLFDNEPVDADDLIPSRHEEADGTPVAAPKSKKSKSKEQA